MIPLKTQGLYYQFCANTLTIRIPDAHTQYCPKSISDKNERGDWLDRYAHETADIIQKYRRKNETNNK